MQPQLLTQLRDLQLTGMANGDITESGVQEV